MNEFQRLEPEVADTHHRSLVLGPFHEAFTGPMKVKVRVDGEIIVGAEVTLGYMHRGLEKAFEIQKWSGVIPYADRLDPEAAPFAELALCLAAEEIAGWEVPERAQRIRLLLSELTRVSSHICYLIKVAKAVGSQTMIHYLLRDRERILDLFELLTGARFSHNYICFGGVSQDVSEGFVERLGDVCEVIRIRIKEYNDLFTYNFANLKRMGYTGVIPQDWIQEFGITGPIARASGVAFDVRRDHPYTGFDRVDFSIPMGEGRYGVPGDSHDRLLVRLREITQSLNILGQAGDRLPEGEFTNSVPRQKTKVPVGESYVRVESARGLLGCHLVSDGTGSPARVQFRVPSAGAFAMVPRVLIGCRLEDLPVVIASLDLGVAEVDR